MWSPWLVMQVVAHFVDVVDVVASYGVVKMSLLFVMQYAAHIAGVVDVVESCNWSIGHCCYWRL